MLFSSATPLPRLLAAWFFAPAAPLTGSGGFFSFPEEQKEGVSPWSWSSSWPI
jgi:hypothetical protein